MNEVQEIETVILFHVNLHGEADPVSVPLNASLGNPELSIKNVHGYLYKILPLNMND